MIEFATMCIGKDWVFDWKDEIIEFHNKHKLHLLSDTGDWFHFESYKYNKEFSYYDKLIFLLDIMTLKKKRITYLDVDKLQQYNSIDYDDSSCYVYNTTTTPIKLSRQNPPINYSSKVLLLGSCFVQNMGEKLEYYKFQQCTNTC